MLQDDKGIIEEAFRVFPRSKPARVVDADWGDYVEACDFVTRLGTDPTFEEIFFNRSRLTFVTPQAWLFLCAYFLKQAFHDNRVDADILDALLFTVQRRILDQTADVSLSAAQLDVLFRWFELVDRLFADEGCPDVEVRETAERLRSRRSEIK